jgi:hypothetical protein
MRQRVKQVTPQPVWRLASETRDALGRAAQWPAARFSPLRRQSMRRLAALKDVHRGERCFIIGNGPSLKKTDLSRLSGEFTFGMNRFYLLFDEPLAQDTLADPQSMFSQATMLLDVVEAFYQRVQKPILLAAAYGSWDGAATSCAQDGQGGCLAQQEVLQPGAMLNGLPLDLQEQAQIYETLLAASSNRPWITGFISRGFYPPAMLQDLSPSVNGKPAQAALAYWFANLVIPPP